MDLVLNGDGGNLSQGYHSLIRTLERSNEFHITKSNLIDMPRKYFRKEEGFNVAVVNNTFVAFDANGGYYNIESMYKDGLFRSVLKDVKYIIKTQYHPHRFWDQFQKDTGIKVVSWIMWCTLNFPLSHFQWDPCVNHTYLASCAGGPNSNKRWGRPSFIDWCSRNKNFHTKRLPVLEFADLLKSCRWGLILQGGNKYNCDGKNTREIEYASCGMPLVLNYIPTYEYAFRPNKHFLLLEKPEDLDKLENEDPRPYARASKELWNNYLKPSAAGKYLKKLLNLQ